MSDILKFADREEFRKWLSEHCLSNPWYTGLWIRVNRLCSAPAERPFRWESRSTL